MTTLFNFTYFSFLVCGLAALFAVAYFLSQMPRLAGHLKWLAVLNIIICAVSGALHFYFFTRLQPIAASVAGVDEMAAAIGELPLIVRYAYWLVTTAMLLFMFPLLMGLKRVGLVFALKLVLVDAAMISTGYLGERAILIAHGVNLIAVVWFTVSGLFWAYMTLSIFQVLWRLPSQELIPAQRDALVYMFFFFLIGWAIFPAGFFYAIVFDSGMGMVLREFTVNIGDIVTKVLWGVMVVYAAGEISQSLREEGASRLR